MISIICNGSIIFHINICSNPIVIFGRINISLVLCNTSYVNSGDQCAHNFQDNLKVSVFPYMNDKHVSISMRATYLHMFITNVFIENPTTCDYHFVIDNYLHNHLSPYGFGSIYHPYVYRTMIHFEPLTAVLDEN